MSYHRLGMRTGLMKHGCKFLNCRILYWYEYSYEVYGFFAWLGLGSVFAACRAPSRSGARFSLGSVAAVLSSLGITRFFPRCTFFVPFGGRPVRTFGIGRSVSVVLTEISLLCFCS